jgi:hypothetical protein
MKKILLLALLLFSYGTSVYAQEDAIQRFFSKYMEDERFSRVYISPKMMQMAGGFLKNNAGNDKDAEELGLLIGKIKGIRILSSETVDGFSLYKEVMSTLAKNRYDDLIDVKDTNSSLKFMIKEEGGLVKELLMISGDQKGSFSLISMQGTFTYQDLNLLSERTNIPGMEQYNKGIKGSKAVK